MTISGVSRSVGRPAVSGHRRRCPDTAGLPTDRETPEIVIAGAASSVVYSGHQSRHRGPVRSTAQHTGPGFGIAHTRLRPWVTGGTAASPQSSSCSSPPFPWSRRSFSTGWPVTGRTARCISALRTWAIAVIYGVLGVVGWFIDGLLLGTPVAIPLGPADNVFHLALAAGALVVAVLARGAPRKLAMGAAQRPD